MRENDKISILYSWPVIVLVICFFWPVGIFLIIKRVSIDKKVALSVGKILSIAGGFSYGLAIIYLLACVSEGYDSGDFGIIVFLGLAGFALCKVAKKLKKEAENTKQYLAIIINGNIRQLENIAATTGKSYEVVRTDIQKMIQKGYLKNAYIDEGTREVVLPKKETVENVTATNSRAPENPVQTKIVTCYCCGANNSIVGVRGECEYCGSPLE